MFKDFKDFCSGKRSLLNVRASKVIVWIIIKISTLFLALIWDQTRVSIQVFMIIITLEWNSGHKQTNETVLVRELTILHFKFFKLDTPHDCLNLFKFLPKK